MQHKDTPPEFREHTDVARIHMLENKVAALEDALAKQRALNEELWSWFESDCDAPISESLAVALEKALK